MARLIYDANIPQHIFEKAKAKVSISDKHIGNIPENTYLHIIRKAFYNQHNIGHYSIDDTCYLATDDITFNEFPYDELDKAIAKQASFTTDNPKDRRTNKQQHSLAEYLKRHNYQETVLLTHSFWYPLIEKNTTVKTEKIPVVGLDPSLRNWGMVKADLDLTTGKLHVTDSLLIKPVLPNKKDFRVNSLDILSSEQLFRQAFSYCTGAKAICIEVPIGSQSARAMASYGICVGVIGALKSFGFPIIEVTPNMVKTHVGKRNASKSEVIEWVKNHHPEYNLPKHGDDIVVSKAEHLCDALVAVYAGMKTQEFKTIKESYL